MTVFSDRLEECQRRLGQRDADAVVLSPGPNMYYLSGFHEEPGERHLLLFVSATESAFVAPAMYVEQIREESSVEHIRPWDDDEDPLTLIEALAEEFGIADGRVLLDDHMWTKFCLDLQTTLPESTIGLASTLVDDLRMRKDDDEIARLRRAGRLSDDVCEQIRALGAEAIGLTERELVEEIRDRIEAVGGDGFGFEPIIGSGPNGAKPHYRHGDRTIREGEPVVLDFGTRFERYPGDQTRTVVFAGEPPDGFHDVYETVLEAHHAGVEAAGPGVLAQEVDRAARAVIESAGYGDRFLHRTGHGIGLEVHEPPYIVEGNDTKLQPGMTFSVEPGIYLEGEYGVRIEDIVLVTKDGVERLNDSPRTWEPL